MPWYEYSKDATGTPQPLVEVSLWHGSKRIRIIGQIDSGADSSTFDVTIAEALGLSRVGAVLDSCVLADGSKSPTWSWPSADLQIQFRSDRFPFRGDFVEFAPDADPTNLLGREDFFQGYIIQFWDKESIFNIDSSPDSTRRLRVRSAPGP